MPSLIELYEPRWAADPYPFYARLRERHPVYWDEPLRSWVVTRHADVVALSKDQRLSEDRITPFHRRLSPAKQAVMGPLARTLGNMMLFNDAPRHTELRAMAKGAFTRGAAERLRASIEQNAHDLLDRVVSAGEMDVVTDFAQPLTQAVIADLLGIPPSERCLLDGWASLLHEFFTQSGAENNRLKRLRRVFDEMIDGDREGTFVGHMLAATGGRGGRADDVMFANFVLIIDAGQVTTTHLIPNALRALLTFPEQWARLAGNPGVLPSAAHELMRYDSSVQFTSRIAVEDIEAGGHPIRCGDPVTLVIGAANRDPAVFEDPDRLDVGRDARAHLTFGHGMHYCLGGPLGLVETEVALAAIMSRVTGLRLTGAPLRWQDSINFRFLNGLPVTFVGR